jgi:hypothetical protein
MYGIRDEPTFSELGAEGPHPQHREAMMLFGRFVGSWDMTVRFFDAAGGLVFDGIGRWDFRWVLDGLGVQDVLQYAPAADFPEPRGGRGVGTTLRVLLPADGSWRQVWAAPRAGNFIPMRSEPWAGGIRILGEDMDGSLLRWEFSEISDDAFEWTGWTSADGGASWRVEQSMSARRRR